MKKSVDVPFLVGEGKHCHVCLATAQLDGAAGVHTVLPNNSAQIT